MKFAHLHTHSNYSFLSGASTVDDLAVQAARHNMTALALTDRNGLYGAVLFQKACDRYNIKPIVGVELSTTTASCLAWAKNAKGYATLCRTITALQLHDGPKPSDLAAQLIANRDGLILAARDAAFLQRLVRESGTDNLYVEIRPGKSMWNDYAVCRNTGLPPLATNNVHFASPEGHTRHHLLTAISLNTSLSGIPQGAVADDNCWLKAPIVMHHAFRDLPQAVTNTLSVAEQCEFRLDLGKLRLPKFPFAKGKPSFELLRDKVEAGLSRRYGHVNKAVRRQVEHELDIIRQMNYSDYFLIVADIVDAAKQRGIPTCGRGSAANSVVAYVLELTHVEPLANNLYFERFLNRGRADCPDVDIDFAWCDRDRVIDWVMERYGKDRVAMISTHVTFAARGAVREIAKVMGVPPDDITRITRRLPSGWGWDNDDVADVVRNDPRARDLPVGEEPWRTIFAWSRNIKGFPKHLGIHAGGIVVAPSPLTDHLPLQYAAKETAAGHVIVTQWDMYPVEDAGLVKIDLLGNRSLAVIADAVDAVEADTGETIDYTTFDPTSDHKTKQIIRRGGTMGCFYVESPSMRSLLKKLDCHTFDGLVAASSIVRPGISSSGMMQAYIERFHYVREHGRHNPAWYLLPAMRDALADTYGVMAYQEDVLKVGENIAGMSPHDADGLRKAMSKKRDFVAIERYKRQFIGGALKNGCPRDTADELWRQIESFSGYSFCKAHSASFALVSYQAAYLRAHHPAAFIAAVLSNYGGFYSTFAYISEARRMGLRVLAPCVNRSKRHYTSTGETVRVSLAQLRHITAERIDMLLTERNRGGPFTDLRDLIDRVPLREQDIDLLIQSGACDQVAGNLNRPELLRLRVLLRAEQPRRESRNGDLFPSRALPQVPRVRNYDKDRIIAAEIEALGFPVSAHPLALYQAQLAGAETISATDLERHIGKTVTLVGWQVTRKRVQTKHDEPMVFITFEDTHALYETVMFPREYDRLAPLTMNPGPFLVTGTPTEEFGVVTLTVTDLRLLPAISTSMRSDDAPINQAA